MADEKDIVDAIIANAMIVEKSQYWQNIGTEVEKIEQNVAKSQDIAYLQKQQESLKDVIDIAKKILYANIKLGKKDYLNLQVQKQFIDDIQKTSKSISAKIEEQSQNLQVNNSVQQQKAAIAPKAVAASKTVAPKVVQKAAGESQGERHRRNAVIFNTEAVQEKKSVQQQANNAENKNFSTDKSEVSKQGTIVQQQNKSEGNAMQSNGGKSAAGTKTNSMASTTGGQKNVEIEMQDLSSASSSPLNLAKNKSQTNSVASTKNNSAAGTKKEQQSVDIEMQDLSQTDQKKTPFGPANAKSTAEFEAQRNARLDNAKQLDAVSKASKTTEQKAAAPQKTSAGPAKPSAWQAITSKKSKSKEGAKSTPATQQKSSTAEPVKTATPKAKKPSFFSRIGQKMSQVFKKKEDKAKSTPSTQQNSGAAKPAETATPETKKPSIWRRIGQKISQSKALKWGGALAVAMTIASGGGLVTGALATAASVVMPLLPAIALIAAAVYAYRKISQAITSAKGAGGVDQQQKVPEKEAGRGVGLDQERGQSQGKGQQVDKDGKAGVAASSKENSVVKGSQENGKAEVVASSKENSVVKGSQENGKAEVAARPRANSVPAQIKCKEAEFGAKVPSTPATGQAKVGVSKVGGRQ